MHYCISDIHGERDRYVEMLNLIGLSDTDRLYVIGDVIDRAPGGVDILQDIMGRNNVTMLMGNHEQMCLDTLGPNNLYGARALWDANGGSNTRRELLYLMDAAQRRRILNFIENLPDHLDVEVGESTYHLVHGFPSSEHEARIWERPEVSLDQPNPFSDGRKVIVGHTPVCFLTHPDRESRRKWLETLEENGDHLKILHTTWLIDIDCGCGNKTTARRLACLRLEDMKEFYV